MGLDFGTIYSGMCWVKSTGQVQDIEVIKNYPGRSEIASKVPSRMAYVSENPKLSENKFRFLIKPSYQQVAWFKLRLDEDARPTEFDDPNLKTLSDPSEDRLPGRLSAKIVTKDFLKELHVLLMKDLAKLIHKSELYSIPIEVWLTVPASWSDPAKMKTRNAAIEAGFGKQAKDSVKIITEPEAAGIFALCPEVNQGDGLVNIGETFVVCDCRGGTVDLTAYTLKSGPPTSKFQEVCKGKAGKCGSTMIDRAFCEWMEKQFGEAYTDLPLADRGPGSRLMRDFEDHKATFGSETLRNLKREYVEVEPLEMDVARLSKYDQDTDTVNLSLKTFKGFFDKAIKHIIQLLSEQIQEAKAALGGRNVDRVILVGGLGNNLYVRDQLIAWCDQQNPLLGLISPPLGDSQTCIMRGAAICGLLGMQLTYRVSRRHYGFGVSLPFREDIDSQENAWYDDEGDKMCYTRIEWLLRKRQFIENDFHIEVEVRKHFTRTSKRQDKIELWACDEDQAPDYDTDWTYSDTLKKPCQVLRYKVRANMAADEGVLTVEIAGDRVFATRTIVFHEMR
ncbi:hsp70-like protein [Phyllosticta capitalensis]|uniref:Hsp70-like protein n=1 Tax=Phyllosticta capitalensis TaxID=121624 RepID=A0ABR1YP02_9PEZI